MSWDFRLNENWDLSPGEVTGSDEVMQRLKLRLLRELGEWFLDTTAGLPWYQDGHGMLGAKMSQQSNVLLLIRRCVMGTEGVKALEKLTTRYILGNRTFSVYIRVILTDRTVRELTLPVTASTFAA